ncbi:PQQ-dependent sugar dehydrogenase [Nocardioides sp. 503]|uniref:PQQ-dependent sugar dehydrogenase n=1 Tax=Nocardioides sp. 503 TaxID=2508326 RepID=UPI00142F85AD|nr:PQQ-dependent sugar dehydrogenase [Nocardioides sp. 503]
MLRILVAVLAVVCGTVSASVVVPPAAAAAGGRPSVSLSPSAAMVGEQVRVATRLASRVRRPVRLERRSGRTWVAVRTGTSTHAGRVAFTVAAPPGATSFRVVAPRHRVGGRRYASLVSRPATVRATRPTVGLTVSHGSGGLVDATVTVSHARAGRVVALQAQSDDGHWSTLSSRRAGASRSVLLAGATTLEAVRGKPLRGWVAAHRGAPATSSAVHLPPSVSAPTVLDGDTARLGVTTSGAVRAVRFYVDGVLAAEDTAAPWQATVSPRVGEHDVLARAVGPLESATSPVVGLVRAASPLGADSGVAEGFAMERVQSGLSLPTSAAVLPGGAVLVAEKSGRVVVVEPTADAGAVAWSPPRVVLDLTADVADEGDGGLTGLAVDPAFAQNGYVYLAYVLDGGPDVPRSQQVARLTWDGTVLDPASRHVVLGSVTGAACSEPADIRTPDCVPLIGEAHTIGDLAFDEEVRLLVGVGDGALYASPTGLSGRLETWRAQDPDVLAGKILRIDPTSGRGVPDNPLHTGDGSSNASRVLALGLRNPFRFVVRGDRLVVGDVGENAWEEIDLVPLGPGERGSAPNFGWPCREGDADTSLGDVSDPESPWRGCLAVRAPGGSRPPAHAYPHRSDGGSVTAGVFLDSPGYPEHVRGRFVFGDYAQMFIRTAELTTGGDVSAVADLADSSAAGGPVRFFTGPDGWAWSVSLVSGSLERIRWTGDAAVDTCPVGTFRRTFHDLDGPDSEFDREHTSDPAYSWMYPYAAVQLPGEALAGATCEPDVRLPSTDGSPWTGPEEPDTRAHPGDRWGTAWRGRIDVEPGTYRFRVDGTEWVRVWVDDRPLHDFYATAFWGDERVHDVVLTRGQHIVRAEHVHGDEATAAAEVTWERVGGPPSVALVLPADGYVAADGSVPWSVEVGDPDGDDLAGLTERTELEVDLLHYTGNTFHAHPSSRITGRLSGTLHVDDVHSPGSVVVRLRATVTDASGARTRSLPAYVCLSGSAAGPCAG